MPPHHHLLRRGSLALLCVARSGLRSSLPRRCQPLSSASPLHNEFGSLHLTRHYATRSAADGYLVEVLKSEIEHELQQETTKQGSSKASTGPFELEDKPGTEEVVLKRSFGNEQIAVICLFESQLQDEEEEEENEDEGSAVKESQAVECLHLNVNITKGAETPVLEIECTFYRGSNEIMIDSVSYVTDLSTDDTDKKTQPYEGPNFEDLDENLRRAFHDLLKARGLSIRVATNVMDYLTGKERREYVRWLRNVETFFTV